MLIIESLLEKMKLNFPKYMDIRRKLKTSSGGLSIYSVAEEISEINEEIEEYKKSFFIENYIGKEDQIIDFIYKCNIGEYDHELVKITNPSIEITTSEEEFYKNKDMALYSEGVIYVKENYVNIQYSIENYISTSSLEKMHVWNIYDEFAIFVGIERYQWETNRELLNRILFKSNKVINSTEQGLKNAILTNLINIAPSLNSNDISIERPTAENLKKYYDEKTTILDHLSEVNRDVYKNKRWDIDTWNFDFKSVDYISHNWDILLKEYANGVGDKKDLEVTIVDNSLATDAEVSFYGKKEEVVNSYVKNNNVKENFKLKLRKYENDLIAEKVKYRINASEAIEINPDNITFDLYEDKVGESELLLQDIADDFLVDIDIKDNSILDPTFKYKARFYSNKEFGNFRISKFKQISDDLTETNLIKDVQGFSYTDSLKEGVKLGGTRYITNKYQFSSIENIEKQIDGFVISDISEPGIFRLNINDSPGKTLYYDYNVKTVPLLYSNIERTNCYILNDYIIPDTVEEEKSIYINKDLNYLALQIDGAYSIEYIINDNNIQSIQNYNNTTYKFEIEQSDIPKNVKIKIKLLSKDTKIYDIVYSHFEFRMVPDKGVFLNNKLGSSLPNYNSNNLTISMKTYTGFSPELRYIHIGNKLNYNNITYGEIDIDPANGTKIDCRFKDCIMVLDKYDSLGNLVESIDNYRPYKQFFSTLNNAQLEIYLDKYISIDRIDANGGVVATTNYGNGYIQHSLKIPSGVYIDSILIEGVSQSLIQRKTLAYVLDKKGYSKENNVFYITRNKEEIIAHRTDNTLAYLKILREDLLDDLNITNINVLNYSETEFNTKFVEIDEVNYPKATTIIENFDGYFDYISLEPINSNSYSAINVYDTLFPKVENISIVNTFSRGYDDSKFMFYSLESFNDDYEVIFNNGSSYILDNGTITIIRKNGDTIKYNYETLEINKEFVLGTKIEIARTFNLANNEQIDISQYVIINEDLNIEYKDKELDNKNSSDYERAENIYVSETGFNKLKYSNIKTIDNISYKNEDGLIILLKEDIHYKLLKKEGILIWQDQEIINSLNVINISYNIRIPKYILIDTSKLYEKVKYYIDAYELISKVKLEKIKSGYEMNLNLFDSYATSDLVSVNFTEPGFISKVENDTLQVTRNLANNTVAVQSGFYYMDGNEYYLFANDNFDNVEKIDNVYLNDVIKENKQLILKQQTTNYIKNSSMITNKINSIYNLNASDKVINGISTLNSISACDNYNYWNINGCSLSIVEGLNGQGIKVNCLNKSGYAYISLDKYIKRGIEYMLSFYLSGEDAEAYLGKERSLYSTNSDFNKESVIDIIGEIPNSEIYQIMKEVTLMSETPDDKYFLIVKGTGIIDDIILIEKKDYDISYHKKNIDILNLNIDENIYSSYETRLFLQYEEGSEFDGTEINHEDSIVNSSYIDWGFTKYKTIETYEDFKKCTLTNIDLQQFNNKTIAYTTDTEGSIVTGAIYIGNVKVIKNLLFKINNVMFNNMAKFKTTIYTSDNPNSNFKEVSKHLDNIGSISGDNLSSYIKIKVEMAKDKVINNIELFIEYLSDNINTPADMAVISGSYISKVLDAQYTNKFLVKNLNVENNNESLGNYIFYIRASKENNENNVWTDWKEIVINKDSSKIANRIVFNDYRYFQFKLILKGKDTSIKINYIDLEVI